MRRNKADTAASRRAIVGHAARMIRERGPDRVSVVDVMAAAGMTHGGFYSHFPSKEDLLAAAVERAFSEKLDHLDTLEDKARTDAVVGYIDGYLTLDHAHNLGWGCPIAGLAPDAARMAESLGSVMAEGVERTLATFSEALEARFGDLARANAIEVLASMVGTLVLTRALGDAGVQAEVIETMRQSDPLASVLPDGARSRRRRDGLRLARGRL